ncbi:MAG: alanyl-tRNA editing protein [Candidatus Micrarchaeota archaeon]|nr:alanyl-tRNA editing protein [Candidatus Micrarchaeota archaeon]
MTEKLYLTDSYVKEFEAKVTAIEDNLVQLDRTAFFPTGGGQLCDTGILEASGREYKVVETAKTGDEVLHKLESAEGLKIGDSVKGKIDWSRRYALMRLHTALHVMDAVVVKNHSNGQITGGQIYEHKARIDFDMEGVSKGLVEKIVAESQKIVDEGHPVRVRFLSKDEAAKVPGLARTAPGAELLKKLDIVRVVDIGEHDFQLDGGTHVGDTKEIGRIKLIGYENKGSRRKRIEIAVD